MYSLFSFIFAIIKCKQTIIDLENFPHAERSCEIQSIPVRSVMEATCAQMNNRKKGGLQEFNNVSEDTKGPPGFTSAKAARSTYAAWAICGFILWWEPKLQDLKNTHTPLHI